MTARTCFIFSGRVGRWVIGWLVGRLVWFGLVWFLETGAHSVVQTGLEYIV